MAIFSLAASIFCVFYKPPGHHQVPAKKMQKDQIVSIPVDFENMKVPKKQIKKQLKTLIKGKPNTKESMLWDPKVYKDNFCKSLHSGAHDPLSNCTQ